MAITPPPDAESTWRSMELDTKTLSKMSVSDLVSLLVDISPEISRALWDFIRMFNPGWEYQVFRPGSDVEDDSARQLIEGYLEQLKELYGSTDIPINRLVLGAFIRGAFFAELVLDENGVLPVDLATPDPNSARFKKVNDPVRGNIWELGQYQGGEWVSFTDEPTVKYIPIDPMPNSPYGRPLITGAVFTAIFTIGILHDLRRVIMQQGWPRIDLAVNMEKLRAAMPTDLLNDPQEAKTWVDAIISEVRSVYAELEPDDAYIHTDVVEVNTPVGTVDSNSLSAVDGIITMLERMAVRALKTMPLMLALNETGSETHANRQWEIHAAGIKSVQHLLENLLEHLLQQMLRAQGIQSIVEWRFAELRASEMLRDAQTEAMQIANEKSKYDHGWISQDEASEAITGHKADVLEPRVSSNSGGGFIQGDGEGNDPTEMRYRGRAVQLIPNGSEQPLPPEPDEVEINNDDADRAIRKWDELMPDYAGLLNATVIGQTDFDEEFTEGESDWEWNQDKKRYRNTVTGEIVNQSDLRRLRDEFIDKLKRRDERKAAGLHTRQVEELAEKLANGDIDIQRWLVEMRQEVKDAYLGEYMTARGGKAVMTFADYGRVGNMLAPHGVYSRLQQFAEDISDGKYSLAQIRNYSRQYIASATQAFERGRAASHGVQLPEYPADGNQICRDNCKCEWVIREYEDRWECFWELNPAEHCDSCLENNARWNPLIIEKNIIRSREELERILNNGNGVTHH